MTVSLAMIVRDAEAELPACLASAAAVVDEVVVADTGSRDATRERARALGARVLEIPWEQDFACARNRGLEAVRGDWVLVLDADERLDPGPARAWRAQLASPCAAFQVTIRNYVTSLRSRVWDRSARPNDGAFGEAARFPGYIEHENVRLFRRRPELRFTGRVHESVGPSVQAAGLRLGRARGRIHHFGLTLAPQATAAKNLSYRQLARHKIADQPGDPQAHFELGVMEFDNFGDHAAALRCFEQALRLKPEFALAWFFAGAALQRMGQAETALAFFAQAEGRGYRASHLSEMQADALYQLERFAPAAARYRHALRQDRANHGLASKLGLAELRAGTAEGLARLRRAAAAAPEISANHDRLVAALIWCKDLAGAAAALEARLRQFPRESQGYLRLAALEAERGRAGEASRILATGMRILPEDALLRQAWRGSQPAVELKPPLAQADKGPEWKNSGSRVG